MKYLLQIYPHQGPEEFERLSMDEQDALVAEYLAVSRSPGVVDGAQLQPVDTATTVRVANGETLLTDGPFMDAKEHVGGFMLVEAEDLDVALDLAARIPAARMGGAVEVRPLVERLEAWCGLWARSAGGLRAAQRGRLSAHRYLQVSASTDPTALLGACPPRTHP
jgi:hypothetical protein